METMNPEKINESIYAVLTPYKDVFTTVYLIKTERGALLFDAASYDCDVDDAIVPALSALGIGEDELQYVFISHNHADHAGGLGRLLEYYPQVCVVSGSASLKEKLEGSRFLAPEEGETLLDVLSVVRITGHTRDSAALYDRRTGTLISGDCLQLYGLFGSGSWGANISYPSEYAAAIRKIREMDVNAILTAHDYHPYGRMHFGKDEVMRALDACLEPLRLIGRLIEETPDADDATICAVYNRQNRLPRLGAHVVRACRAVKKGEPDNF